MSIDVTAGPLIFMGRRMKIIQELQSSGWVGGWVVAGGWVLVGWAASIVCCSGIPTPLMAENKGNAGIPTNASCRNLHY